MSAIRTDLDPNSYIGLSFPLRRNNNRDFAMTKNSLEQSQHNLKNLLLTYPGERVGQPEFGCKLRELVFEHIDEEELPVRIEDEIKDSVSKWLPYINIISVETLTQDDDKSKIYVKIKYSTSINPETENEIELDTSYTATRY